MTPPLPHITSVSRRNFVVSGLCLTLGSALGACSDGTLSNLARNFKFIPGVKTGPDIKLSRAQVNNIPYATMYAKIGNAPVNLIVLGQQTGKDLHWISADHSVVVTRGGRLLKTVGLSENLVNTRLLDPDPVVSGARATSRSMRRLIDLSPGNHFNIKVQSNFEIEKEERISISELTFDTVVLKENCVAAELGWSFENRFWKDRKTGFVWKSIQHFSHKSPPLHLEVLKPAA